MRADQRYMMIRAIVSARIDETKIKEIKKVPDRWIATVCESEAESIADAIIDYLWGIGPVVPPKPFPSFTTESIVAHDAAGLQNSGNAERGTEPT